MPRTTKKSAKKSASKKTAGAAKRSSKGIVIGSAEHEQAKTTSNFLKLENTNGPNMFVLAHGSYYAMLSHYLRGETQTESALCVAHRDTGNEVEMARRVMKGFAPDICPVCELAMTLFREAKQDPEDPINKAKKELAKDIRGNLQILFVAAPIEYEMTRERKTGSQIITPFVPDNLRWGHLALTEAAFRKFEAQFNLDGMDGADLEGCPVNFIRGKDGDKTYSEVQSVTLYPKQKIVVPDSIPDFDSLPEFDEQAIEKMAEKIESELDSMIALKMKGSAKAAKKKGTRKRK